jgi:hypothetical protein
MQADPVRAPAAASEATHDGRSSTISPVAIQFTAGAIGRLGVSETKELIRVRILPKESRCSNHFTAQLAQ